MKRAERIPKLMKLNEMKYTLLSMIGKFVMDSIVSNSTEPGTLNITQNLHTHHTHTHKNNQLINLSSEPIQKIQVTKKINT